jgi:clan AA aspartic protease (TIGR02281 family)
MVRGVRVLRRESGRPYIVWIILKPFWLLTVLAFSITACGGGWSPEARQGCFLDSQGHINPECEARPFTQQSPPRITASTAVQPAPFRPVSIAPRTECFLDAQGRINPECEARPFSQQAPPQTVTAPIARLPSTAPPVSVAPQIQSRPSEMVQLIQHGGTFMVPVEVNGKITLDFILDSGAADVSIPADVWLTLIRTGTITERDFTGTKTYVLADGSKQRSQTFIMHTLKVGNHIVRDVAASVTTVNGGLLLGQSFLSKFPSWAIDNKRHALIIGDE